VQSEHHAFVSSLSQIWPPVQSVTTDHVAGTSLPVQAAAPPVQYLFTVRCRALSPHAVPAHPYSTQLSQTCPASQNSPLLQQAPVEQSAPSHSPAVQP
jgi:hypothetical protein